MMFTNFRSYFHMCIFVSYHKVSYITNNYLKRPETVWLILFTHFIAQILHLLRSRAGRSNGRMTQSRRI